MQALTIYTSQVEYLSDMKKECLSSINLLIHSLKIFFPRSLVEYQLCARNII